MNLIFRQILFFSILPCTAFCNEKKYFDTKVSATQSYYFSGSGDDANDGSINHPFNSINKLNSLHLNAGDRIYFHGRDIFDGSIFIDSMTNGTEQHPITIASYGGGMAIINSGSKTAISVYQSKFIILKNLVCAGDGRKRGNTKDGLLISNSENITIDSVDVSGFQKAGLLVYASSAITISHVYAHDNGFAGISVLGRHEKSDCHDIYIGHCIAENNPGDPTNLDNHSGNGIIAGICRSVEIEYCSATNNGWDMPRIGNGPVGIWCYEADSVIIQHCLSYRNKTSVGGGDGGGFDLDGGVTNSIIQYCLSYENAGSGFGIFQYAGASAWHNNIIRYNISENDGLLSQAHAGAFIWNSSRDEKQFNHLMFYNNVIFNSHGAAINYATESENADFCFYNNIFVAKDSLIFGKETSSTYIANDWWSLSDKFNIGGMKIFSEWALHNNKEQLNHKIVGMNIDPMFNTAGRASITSAERLATFSNYVLPPNSLLKTNGVNLFKIYGIDIGGYDFLLSPAPEQGIGACLGITDLRNF